MLVVGSEKGGDVINSMVKFSTIIFIKLVIVSYVVQTSMIRNVALHCSTVSQRLLHVSLGMVGRTVNNSSDVGN